MTRRRDARGEGREREREPGCCSHANMPYMRGGVMKTARIANQLH